MARELQNYAIHGVAVRSAIPFIGEDIRTNSEGVEPVAVVLIEAPRHIANDFAAMAPGDGQPDQTLTVFQTAWCEIDRDARATGPDQLFAMRYPLHGFMFRITASPQHIRIEPLVLGGEWIQMLPVMLRGAVLTFACRLLGLPALHANAIRIGNETVAFAGESGAGKTLTSALTLLAGAQLISDDVTVVGHDGVVHPGLLEVRLRVDDPLGQVISDQLNSLPGARMQATADERASFQFEGSPQAGSLSRVILPCLDATAQGFTLEPLALPDALMELLKGCRLIGWLDPAYQRSDFLFVASLTERAQIQRLRMPLITANPAGVAAATTQLADLLAASDATATIQR
jgi:hypothetical protein